MATCKDCIHHNLCDANECLQVVTDIIDDSINYIYLGNVQNRCAFFKNKADVVEVKHGKWVYWQPDGLNHLWNCSVCNNSIRTPMNFVANHIKYCQHCGAKMDGERKCDNGKQ